MGSDIKMSETILLSGRSNVLESVFSPPLALDPRKVHYIGLVEFVTFNAVPNINKSNQVFCYGPEKKELIIPKGAYEITAIEKFLQSKLGPENLTLQANNSTLRCLIKCSEDIHFDQPRSIGRLLGFLPKRLSAGEEHESELPVNIISVNIIRVECNIATGSYINGAVAHTIFAFSPNVPPGYKMALSPRTIIYNRINTTSIDRLRISIVDQDGKPVDFGGETVTVRLHIKTIANSDG